VVLTEPTDDDLIRRHRAGDRYASTTLHQRYAQHVHFYILHLVRDRDAADEVSQATWLNALNAIADGGTYKLRTTFWAWLRTIAHHACMDHFRRNRRVPITLDAESGDVDSQQLERVPTREVPADRIAIAAELLDVLLGQLDVNQRAALILVDLEDRTYEEAAGILGVPVGTVMSRVWRGRRVIRDYIDERGIDL
jgi:RNA polymerase sigma-70 factor (ECF subfamily)